MPYCTILIVLHIKYSCTRWNINPSSKPMHLLTALINSLIVKFERKILKKSERLLIRAHYWNYHE